MAFLLWIENSSLVNWLITTTWVYPWVISFHSIGMGFLVGVIYMLALRVLGFGRFSIAPLEKFLLVVRIAFGISLCTGIILFILDVQHFFFSPTFRVKMLLIVLGAISGLMLTKAVFRDGAGWLEDGRAPQSARAIAAVTLLCWTGAIVAGRLTAYLP